MQLIAEGKVSLMTCGWWLVTDDGLRAQTWTNTWTSTITSTITSTSNAPAICNSAKCQSYRTIIQSIVASHCHSWLPDARSLLLCSTLPYPTVFYFTLLCPSARTQARTTKTETMLGTTPKKRCSGPRLLMTSSCYLRSPSCHKCSLKYALTLPAVRTIGTVFTVVQFIYLSYL